MFFPLFFIEKIADPKSPSGGSYAFSKPKPRSVEISNSSFVLQCTYLTFFRAYLDTILKVLDTNVLGKKMN